YTDSTNQVPTASWCHVAMTYSCASNKLRVYLNGVLDGSASVSGTMITTTEPVLIGGASYAGCWNYYFRGLIEEPTLYARALTATEISAIYSAGYAGKCKNDTDADGLSDLQEAFLATNPTNPDTDHDQLSDGDEVFVYHTNPSNSDSDYD